MFVCRDASECASAVPPHVRTSVTLGVFDGVHRGHQALLHKTLSLRPEGGLAVACTFWPHPVSVTRPAEAPVAIASLPARLERFRARGLDGVLVHPFDAEAAAESAEEFIERVLVRGLRAAHVIVGKPFRFGRGRKGDVAMLTALGQRFDFVAHGLEAICDDGGVLSSTRVRAALKVGDVVEATRLLGAPYDIAGVVVHGDARGRTLGYPTANVEADVPNALPLGIYAARAQLADGHTFLAAVSIGVHPTFTAAAATKIEAHLLDFLPHPFERLYGQRLRLSFVARLRGEEAFASVDALLAQMACDVRRVREIFHEQEEVSPPAPSA